MLSIKGKKRLSLCLATLVLGINLMCFSTVVFAEPNGLNEIGGSQQTVETPVAPSTSNEASNTQVTTPSTSQGSTQTTQPTQQTPAQSSNNTSESNKDSAAAVGEIFKQGGLTSESVEKSKKWVEPVAKVINLAMAVVLGIFSALLVFVSVLDLVYIGLPFTRPYLCPNSQQAQSQPGMGASPMMGGYGRGGMMGGMAGGMQQQQQSSGLAATIGQWISDDALNAVREAQVTQGQQGAAPMMGAYGMQQTQQAQPKGKSLVIGYLKKRSFTLIMLGVCLVLFTCTIFTDLGTMIGMKLLALLSGINM